MFPRCFAFRLRPPNGRGGPRPGFRGAGVLLFPAVLFLAGSAPLSARESAAVPAPVVPAPGAALRHAVEAAAGRIRPGVSLVERTFAAEFLAGAGPAARPQAETLARSPFAVARVAALVVFQGLAAPADAFIPFLDDPAPAVRTAALDGVRDAPETPGATALLHRLPSLLHDPFWTVRRAAVEALAAHPRSGTGRILLKALLDPDPLVRAAAIDGLADLEEDLSAGALHAAARALEPPELGRFLKSSLPLVREENRVFFETLADRPPGRREGILARVAVAALTRSVDPAQLPLLVRSSFDADRDTAEAADVLLALAGEAVVPVVRAFLVEPDPPQAESPPPSSLVHLLLSVLDRGAVPVLAAWVMDTDLPVAARSACLEGMVLRDWEEGASALVKVYPRLEEPFARDAVWKAFALARTEIGSRVAPLLLAALEHPDPAVRDKAFAGLCLLPDPPVEALLSFFRKVTDPTRRGALADNLVNAARGDGRAKIARLFLEEMERGGPAALEAASQFHRVDRGVLAGAAVAAIQALLEQRRDPAARETLVLALVYLDRPDADRLAAEILAADLAAGKAGDPAFLVAHLDETHGTATLDLLHRLFPETPEPLQRRILRTLVRRHDPACAPWVEETFRSAGLGYKRSILEEMKGTPVAEACKELFRSVLRRERDPDLLAAAVEAAPLSVLSEEVDRLLALADLGPGLGLDTMEAVYRALARAGGDRGRDRLRAQVKAFLGRCADGKGRAAFEAGEGDLALLAAAALAAVRDAEAPELLARLLFQRARAFRKQAIAAAWSDRAGVWDGGKAHGWERAVLRNLLVFEDPVVETAAGAVLDTWAEEGRLFSCGDAAFCTVCRELAAEKRCPTLRARLAELTLRCAPLHSPSDFRVHLQRADAAEARRDPAAAAAALAAAYRILRFHPPARSVVRDELGDPDPFQGYFPEAALASDVHHMRALALEAAGRTDEAAREARLARRRSPFRRRSGTGKRGESRGP